VISTFAGGGTPWLGESIPEMFSFSEFSNHDGHTSAARVLTGHDLLKDAALEAARKFVVEPQPSAVTTTAELNFMLN
jgi:hypothetical protein